MLVRIFKKKKKKFNQSWRAFHHDALEGWSVVSLERRMTGKRALEADGG